jgi:hypothetical protein
MVYRAVRRHWFRALGIVGLCFALTHHLSAQAWVPQKGQGSISLSYQRINNSGHILSDGVLFEGGRSVNISLFLEVDYAATNRLSFTAGLPYVFGKYTDPLPPAGTLLPFLPKDSCHCWHSGPQDVGFTAHYNILRAEGGAFSITPSASVVLPSQNYDFRGESALGRHLRQYIFGLDAGWRLDVISSNLAVQGHYSFALVERAVNDVPLNRSNIGVEATYAFMKRRLVARGVAYWQRMHGGLILGSPFSSPGPPFEFNTPERLYQFDRLVRENYFHAGGGFTYSFPRIDVFASYIPYVNGRQTHAGRALSVGVSWPFEVRHRHSRI